MSKVYAFAAIRKRLRYHSRPRGWLLTTCASNRVCQRLPHSWHHTPAALRGPEGVRKGSGGGQEGVRRGVRRGSGGD
eukprot:1186040-Prorocentrum_minimum.AAC.11